MSIKEKKKKKRNCNVARPSIRHRLMLCVQCGCNVPSTAVEAQSRCHNVHMSDPLWITLDTGWQFGQEEEEPAEEGS